MSDFQVGRALECARHLLIQPFGCTLHTGACVSRNPASSTSTQDKAHARMRVDPRELAAEACYRLMTGVVVPRPIAWVTTVNAAGVVNLAPFSHFTFVAPKPPMVAISIGRKGTVYKDTARNILANEEFVVHIPHAAQAEAVHASAIEHPPEVSEVEMLGLATRPSEMVGPPRLVDARLVLECRLRHVMELGDVGSRLIIGEAVLIHIDDAVLRDGKVETRLVDPLCRLAGPNYAALGEIMTMQAIGQTPKA